MRTLKCFVITPSGKNPSMELVPDDKHGLARLPSGCEGRAAKVTSVNFQDVYEFIILEAIDKVNAIAPQGLRIQVTRGEDLAQGGNIVSQFLQQICRAEITITDVTGLNPNVLLEYGIRLSVRDSLNLLLCHRGVLLPIDIADQRYIEYTQEPAGVKQAREEIVRAIQHSLPTLSQETPESVENLFRRTVEVATGRHLERRLTQAFAPSAELTADLANELQRLAGATPKLRDRCWNFLEGLAETLLADPLGRERAIKIYSLLARLDGFREKRRDVFYKLNEICAEDPDRQADALAYLEQAKTLEIS
ncbi:MAG: hypothetical protein M3436_09090 [Pseudomonadota bacterium]|nr:hypothetical protein [Pseudomonadota bacterium]